MLKALGSATAAQLCAIYGIVFPLLDSNGKHLQQRKGYDPTHLLKIKNANPLIWDYSWDHSIQSLVKEKILACNQSLQNYSNFQQKQFSVGGKCVLTTKKYKKKLQSQVDQSFLKAYILHVLTAKTALDCVDHLLTVLKLGSWNFTLFYSMSTYTASEVTEAKACCLQAMPVRLASMTSETLKVNIELNQK